MSARPAIFVKGYWVVLTDDSYPLVREAMKRGDEFIDVRRASIKNEVSPQGSQPKLITVRVSDISMLSRNFTEKEQVVTGEVS